MLRMIESSYNCREDGADSHTGTGLQVFPGNRGFALRQTGFLLHDIRSAYRNDPSLHTGLLSFLDLLIYPGIWAIALHRLAHVLFTLRMPFIPRLLCLAARFFTGIEIHPGARIGRGFFIDHGHGVVIGETAEIGDNVLLYQQVTLGGTGLSAGKRHPTLGSNIIIGAGAKILGPITVGDNSMIGAGSIVVRDVPHESVVVGNPGRVIKRFGKRLPIPEGTPAPWHDRPHGENSIIPPDQEASPSGAF